MLDEQIENIVLSGGVAAIGFQYQGNRCERVVVLVGERRTNLKQKPEPCSIERLARAHDDSGRKLRAVSVQPTGAVELALQHRAVEGVLVIASTEVGTHLDDFQSTEISSVAHGRTPIAIPHR